jgi:hypothetical protein
MTLCFLPGNWKVTQMRKTCQKVSFLELMYLQTLHRSVVSRGLSARKSHHTFFMMSRIDCKSSLTTKSNRDTYVCGLGRLSHIEYGNFESHK